ncbi:hypothetical protein ACHAXR_011804 [Thalassiosira sp. AJA248-18]
MIHRLVTSRSVRSLSTCSEALVARCAIRAGATTTSSPQLPVLSSAINHTQQQLPSAPARHFSSSHDDFSPQKKHNLEEAGNDAESTILTMIESHIKANRIMLYMKGSPSQPQCGFSATVVQILKSSGADFASVNVLDYPEVREGVKKYSQWPTIPQLYVDGEFVGGCDIVQSMDESGELKELLVAEEEGDKK